MVASEVHDFDFSCFEVDEWDFCWVGNDSSPCLIFRLGNPAGAVEDCHVSVGSRNNAVNVSCNENVWNSVNDKGVLERVWEVRG